MLTLVSSAAVKFFSRTFQRATTHVVRQRANRNKFFRATSCDANIIRRRESSRRERSRAEVSCRVQTTRQSRV